MSDSEDDESWIPARNAITTAEVLSVQEDPKILLCVTPEGVGPDTHLKKHGEISRIYYRGKWDKYLIYHFTAPIKCGTLCVTWKVDGEEYPYSIFFNEPMDHGGCYRGTDRDGFSVMEGADVFVQLLHPYKTVPPRSSMTDMEYGAIFTLALICKRFRVPRDIFRLLALQVLN